MRNTSPGAVLVAVADIEPELLDSKQSARLAGFSERTWWSMTRSGLAPAPLKIGLGLRPAVRYRRSEILQWIQDGCPRCDGKGDAQR